MKRWLALLIIFGIMGSLIVISGCESSGEGDCDSNQCANDCAHSCMDTCANCEINGQHIDCTNPIDCAAFFTVCSAQIVYSCAGAMCTAIIDPPEYSGSTGPEAVEIPDMGPCSNAVDLVEGVDYEVLLLEADLDYVGIELKILNSFTDIEVCYEVYAQPGNVICEDDYWYSNGIKGFKPGDKFSYCSHHTFKYGPRDAESYTIVITSVRGLQ